MECSCGSPTKDLKRVGPDKQTEIHVVQCKACGKEDRKLFALKEKQYINHLMNTKQHKQVLSDSLE